MTHSVETKNLKVAVGKNLRRQLKLAGMTQSKLAKEYGCSRQYISAIIAEGTVIDSVIKNLASIIGCTESELKQIGAKKCRK